MSASAFPYGAIALAGASGLLGSALITIGYSYPQVGFLDGSFGAISPGTYTDGGSNVRTFKGVVHDVGSGVFGFSLAGASIPNSDTTFSQLELNGFTFVRSSAYYTPSSGGNTLWTWNTANPFPTGTVTLYIY